MDGSIVTTLVVCETIDYIIDKVAVDAFDAELSRLERAHTIRRALEFLRERVNAALPRVDADSHCISDTCVFTGYMSSLMGEVKPVNRDVDEGTELPPIDSACRDVVPLRRPIVVERINPKAATEAALERLLKRPSATRLSTNYGQTQRRGTVDVTADLTVGTKTARRRTPLERSTVTGAPPLIQAATLKDSAGRTGRFADGAGDQPARNLSSAKISLAAAPQAKLEAALPVTTSAHGSHSSVRGLRVLPLPTFALAVEATIDEPPWPDSAHDDQASAATAVANDSAQLPFVDDLSYQPLTTLLTRTDLAPGMTITDGIGRLSRARKHAHQRPAVVAQNRSHSAGGRPLTPTLRPQIPIPHGTVGDGGEGMAITPLTPASSSGLVASRMAGTGRTQPQSTPADVLSRIPDTPQMPAMNGTRRLATGFTTDPCGSGGGGVTIADATDASAFARELLGGRVASLVTSATLASSRPGYDLRVSAAKGDRVTSILPGYRSPGGAVPRHSPTRSTRHRSRPRAGSIFLAEPLPQPTAVDITRSGGLLDVVAPARMPYRVPVPVGQIFELAHGSTAGATADALASPDLRSPRDRTPRRRRSSFDASHLPPPLMPRISHFDTWPLAAEGDLRGSKGTAVFSMRPSSRASVGNADTLRLDEDLHLTAGPGIDRGRRYSNGGDSVKLGPGWETPQAGAHGRTGNGNGVYPHTERKASVGAKPTGVLPAAVRVG